MKRPNLPQSYAALTASLMVTYASVAAAQPAPTHAPAARDRFALLVGANDGGADRVTLRYATTDARAVERVVRELGGVDAANASILLDPSPAELDAGFDALAARLAAAKRPNATRELIVYYSGHSDEQGLLLGGERYAYERLRQRIRTMPAEVHIAILDSCASGAFTRIKGGARRPSFLVDRASQVRGHAFLSSSSADEAAQESDRIGASFFTHFLLSGLRGGADANRDSVVTLSEAYQFAFAETVSRTRGTAHGPQHPAYDMHLVGSGDVVMTDLRATTAALVLTAELDGRVYVRDSGGRLVVELQKLAGAPLILGLAPATYELALHPGDVVYRARLTLRQGAQTAVGMAELRRSETESTVARGGAGGAPGTVSPAADGAPAVVPVRFSVVPGLSTPGSIDATVHLSVNLFVGVSGPLDGLELGGLANVHRGGARGLQLAGLANLGIGPSLGIQAAGLVNGVDGRVRGAQLAGIGNAARGNLWGLQAGGIANLATGDATAWQLAGIGNWSGGALRGVQAAGVANYSSTTWGVQAAGVANVAAGRVDGLQVAGIANMSEGAMHGAQIGLVNVGGDVRGAQVGLVNIARDVVGAQVGLVNVARNYRGAPIGVVNAIANGHHAVEAWASDIAPASVGVKLGSQHVYSLAAVATAEDYLLAGLGLGVHLPIARSYVDIDLTSYAVLERDFELTDGLQLVQLRAVGGLPLGGGVSIFGGPALTASLAYGDDPVVDLSFLPGWTFTNDDLSLRLSPGIVAGLAY